MSSVQVRLRSTGAAAHRLATNLSPGARLVLVAGLVVAALTDFGILLAARNEQAEHVRVAVQTRYLAVEAADAAEMFLHSNVDLLEVAAASPTVRTADPAQIDAYLRELSEVEPDLARVGWVDLDGQVRASTVPGAIGRGVAESEYVRRAMAAGQPFVGEAALAQPDGVPYFGLAVPTQDPDGKVTGALVLMIALDRLEVLLEDLEQWAAATALVVDHTDRLVKVGDLAAPFKDVSASELVRLGREQGKGAVGDGTGLWGDRGMATEAVERPVGYVEDATGLLGDRGRVVAFASVPSAGWLLVVERSAEEAFAPARWEFVSAVAVLLVLAAGGIGGATWVGRRVDRLTEEQRRQTDRLRLLDEATRAFVEAGPDPREVLQTVARRAAELVGDTCAIRLLADDGESLEPVAMYHTDPEARAFQGEVLRAERVRLGVGLIGKTALSGQSLFMPNVPPEEPIVAGRAASRAYQERFRAHSIVVAPLRARGRVIGTLGMGRNVTPRPYTEDDLKTVEELAARAALTLDNAQLFEAEREARTRAEAAVRAREEFLAIAAHELNTPITSVRGFAQFLARRIERAGQVDPTDLRQAVGILEQSSRRLGRLVENLLDVTRLEREELSVEKWDTDLVRLVEAVVEAARRTTRRHQLMVRAPARAMALVDPVRLEQVLTNLLDNAIRYSPDGGEIEVEVTCAGAETVHLAVRDHGLGIPPELRPHIFDRYFRAHAERHYGGMGLGLYVSRQIVEAHGGELAAEFPEDGGTRMVVTLPTGLAAEAVAVSESAR